MESAEFYLDESESDDRWLCVAGWIFSEEGRQALHEEWSALLCKWRLPFFRMSACANRNWPFERERFSAEQCDEMARRFFDALKRHAITGFCATFDTEFAHLCPHAIDDKGRRLFHVTPYTLCCYWSFLYAKRWADKARHDGTIAYFFEAGDPSELQAGRLMKDIFANPDLCRIFRYGAHGFVKKGESAAAQAADILAWQWSKNVKERALGNMKPRADLMALLAAIPCDTVHFDRKTILAFLEEISSHTKKPGHIGVKALTSYWASASGWPIPSYWSGKPPYGGRLPH